MRLYPPVYVIDRVSLNAEELNGITYPAGTTWLMSLFELHRHPELWETPELFLPERFAPELKKGYTGFYFPFGAGPRMCIGNNFAMYEMLLTVGWLLQQPFRQGVVLAGDAGLAVVLALEVPDPLAQLEQPLAHPVEVQLEVVVAPEDLDPEARGHEPREGGEEPRVAGGDHLALDRFLRSRTREHNAARRGCLFFLAANDHAVMQGTNVHFAESPKIARGDVTQFKGLGEFVSTRTK